VKELEVVARWVVRRPWRAAVGAGLGLFLPAPASAQAATLGAASGWTAQVGLQGNWDDGGLNTTFQFQRTFVERLVGGVSYALQNPRSQVTFSTQGSVLAYQGVPPSGRFNYNGELAATRLATPRLTLQFSEAIISVYSQGTPGLAAAGLVFPLVLTRTNQVSGGLSYQLSSRTVGSIAAVHDWVGFDSTSTLVGGWQFRTTASLRHQLTAVDSASLSYSYRISRPQSGAQGQAQGVDTQSVTAGWSHQVNEGLTIVGELGASQINFPAQGRQYGWVGDAGFTRHFQSSSLSARYRHDTGQAFGFGRYRIFDVGSVEYSRNLGRRLTSSARGTYGRSRDLTDPTFILSTQNYSLGLRYAPARQWTMGAAYGWTSIDQATVPVRSGSNLNASLSYGWQWR
jgi:hypothetical protein